MDLCRALQGAYNYLLWNVFFLIDNIIVDGKFQKAMLGPLLAINNSAFYVLCHFEAFILIKFCLWDARYQSQCFNCDLWENDSIGMGWTLGNQSNHTDTSSLFLEIPS